MPKPKPISLNHFYLNSEKKRKKIKNPLVLLKGVRKLRSARKRMIAKELQELKTLTNQKADPKDILKKIERIQSLEKKAGILLRKITGQKNWLLSHDPEFPSLFNRLFFFKKMAAELQKKGQHSLVYLDMDYLKRVNTRFGRQAGGHGLLTAYAKSISKTVSKKGFAGHIGGDEFVIYLPMKAEAAKSFLFSSFGTKSAKVNELKKWANYDKARALKKLSLTFSAGIIQLEPRADVNRAEHAADLLCKMAKRNKQVNTFSIRSNLGKFEEELAGKRTKI